jgi:DNA-binding NtrC family response regulator
MSRRARVLFLKGRGESYNPIMSSLARSAAVESVGTLAAFKKATAARGYEAIFCTARFPGGTYADLLRILRQQRLDLPVIVCSLRGGDREWVQALERGAFDLLVFPFHRSTVAKVLEEALESREVLRFTPRTRSLSA